MKMLERTLVGVLLAGTTLAASAETWPPVSLPAEQQQGEVTFMTGGVGSEEAAAIRDAAAKWPLTLVFVEARRGRESWVADVGVSIRDGKGDTVLDATTDGPFLLARLSPGRYVVEATYNGTAHRKSVTVPAHGARRIVFQWAPNRE